MDLRLFKFCFRASRTGTLIYASVPKAGCTTVQLTLANAYAHAHQLKPLSNPHSPLKTEYFILFKDPDREPLSALLDTRFLFSIVRNPYSRLLSAYLDKIQGKTKEYDRFLRNHGLPAGTDVSFAMFVDLVSQETADEMDQHWAPQHRIIAWDVFRYDYLGFQETFTEDLQHCLSQGGISLAAIDSFLRHSQSASNKLANFYSEELRERVYATYRRDFELFGYSEDIANLQPDREVSKAGMRREARVNPQYAELVASHDAAGRGDVKTAALHLDRWLAVTPADAVDGSDYRLAGQIYLKARRFADAKAALERVLREQPDNQNALIGLARCAFKQGDNNAAANYAKAVLEKSPDSASAARILQRLRD